MMQYALCMFVCLFTLSEANNVIEHVLLSDIKTRGISFSYTNKDEIAGAEEKWLSELVEKATSSRGKTSELEKQLAEYDDNDVIKKEETALDNPRSEAYRNYSTLVLASTAPELTATTQLSGFIFKKVDTCPEIRYFLRYYWEIYRKRICRVVRPFQQYLTHVVCPTIKPCCKKSKFSFCNPEGFVRRRFLVLCYDLQNNSNIKWNIVTRWFPQCCDCHYYA